MATPLRTKVKLALDEARMLVLGLQVLLGFELRSTFEAGFAALPAGAQRLKLAGLGLQLLALVVFLAPAGWHRLAFGGRDAPAFHRAVQAAVGLGLLPFAAAMAVDLAVPWGQLLGRGAAWAAAGAAGLVALGCWYGAGLRARARRGPRPRREERMEPTRIEDKVDQVLTEGRVVLPGAQALFGFQLAITLMESFDKLPRPARAWHLGSLALVALATVLLMTPAAYHRIVERGEATEGFHRVASRLLLAAMGVLALGVASDVALVAWRVTGSRWGGAAFGGGTALAAAGLWFVAPLLARRRRGPGLFAPRAVEG